MIGGHLLGWGQGCWASYSAQHCPKQAPNFNSTSAEKHSATGLFWSPHSSGHQVHLTLPSKHLESSSFFLSTATALTEALTVSWLDYSNNFLPWLFSPPLFHDGYSHDSKIRNFIMSFPIACRLQSKFLKMAKKEKNSRSGTQLFFSPLYISGTPSVDLHFPQINLPFVPLYTPMHGSLCLDYHFPFPSKELLFKNQLLCHLRNQHNQSLLCSKIFSTHSAIELICAI